MSDEDKRVVHDAKLENEMEDRFADAILRGIDGVDSHAEREGQPDARENFLQPLDLPKNEDLLNAWIQEAAAMVARENGGFGPEHLCIAEDGSRDSTRELTLRFNLVRRGIDATPEELEQLEESLNEKSGPPGSRKHS